MTTAVVDDTTESRLTIQCITTFHKVLQWLEQDLNQNSNWIHPTDSLQDPTITMRCTKLNIWVIYASRQCHRTSHGVITRFQRIFENFLNSIKSIILLSTAVNSSCSNPYFTPRAPLYDDFRDCAVQSVLSRLYDWTRWLCHYNDLTLSQSFQPMAAQLSIKFALPLTKILATASCRSSNKGPVVEGDMGRNG